MRGREGRDGRGASMTFLLAAAIALLLIFPLTASAGQEGTAKTATVLKEADRLSAEGNTDKAITILKSAISADPGNVDAYDRLGYLLLRQGKADDAAGAFTSALGIQPNLRTAKTGLGLALLKKGDVQAAEKELTAALSLNPYPSMTHYALGLVYEKTDRYEKAIAEFKEGIRTFKEGRR